MINVSQQVRPTYRTAILSIPATPPWRSVQRSYRNQRTRNSQGHSQRIERLLNVGTLFHWPYSLHPPESSPGISVTYPQKNRLFNIRLKYAIDSICRTADHPDVGVGQEQWEVRRTHSSLLDRWILVSAFVGCAPSFAGTWLQLGSFFNYHHDIRIPLFSPDCCCVDIGEHFRCEKEGYNDCHLQRDCSGRIGHFVA